MSLKISFGCPHVGNRKANRIHSNRIPAKTYSAHDAKFGHHLSKRTIFTRPTARRSTRTTWLERVPRMSLSAISASAPPTTWTNVDSRAQWCCKTLPSTGKRTRNGFSEPLSSKNYSRSLAPSQAQAFAVQSSAQRLAKLFHRGTIPSHTNRLINRIRGLRTLAQRKTRCR